MNREAPSGSATPLRDDPAVGPLLERANGEYAARCPDEVAAFRRLERALQSGGERRRAWRAASILVVTGAAAAAAAAFWLAQPSLPWEREVPLPVAAEPRGPSWTRRAGQSPEERLGAAPRVEAGEASAQAPEVSSRPGESEGAPATELGDSAPAEPSDSAPPEAFDVRARSKSLEPRPRPFKDAADETAPVSPKLRVRPVAPADATGGAEQAEDCLEHARQGDPKTAATCFERRGAGTGLAAEMALYELARLRRDVLGEPEQALRALGEYRTRFPGGTLEQEVAVSRVELLVRLGRGREALADSERLLSSPAGRERAGELHLLRGNVYRQLLQDPAAAALEYERAERAGGVTVGEATFLRASMLETLGNRAAARAAYERAAQRNTGYRKIEAERRREALASAPGSAESEPAAQP